MAAPIGNKNAIGNKGGGRPDKYKPEFVQLVYNYSLLGATDEEMATFLGVGVTTFNRFKKDHIEFVEALKSGKAMADAQVASRLFQRAMGFEHDSEEIKVMTDKDTNEQKIERIPIRKVYAPDTTAAIFWLKNRQPAKWRDRIDQAITIENAEVDFRDAE